MQLYAVNFIPLLGSLYMFRVFYTPSVHMNFVVFPPGCGDSVADF